MRESEKEENHGYVNRSTKHINCTLDFELGLSGGWVDDRNRFSGGRNPPFAFWVVFEGISSDYRCKNSNFSHFVLRIIFLVSMHTVGVFFDLFIFGNGKREGEESEVEFKGEIMIRRRKRKWGRFLWVEVRADVSLNTWRQIPTCVHLFTDFMDF